MPLCVHAQGAVYKTPSVKIPIDVKGQPVSITASAIQEAKKLVDGDAQVQIKLTPQIDENNTELRLVPEMGQIQADGSLGELLRAGPLGEMIRNKVQSSVSTALNKGANLKATLPPSVQDYASIQNAEFKDGGSGNLLVVLDGQVRLTQEQVQYLTSQLKQRISSR
jgi:hypothetical protein